jgi:hypothetical protein
MLIDVTAVPKHVTPVQLQYDIIGEPPEHSHPEYPAATICNAPARPHITAPSVKLMKYINCIDIMITI